MANNQQGNDQVRPGYYGNLTLQEPDGWKRIDRHQDNPNAFKKVSRGTQYKIRVFHVGGPVDSARPPTTHVELYKEEELVSGDPHRGNRNPLHQKIVEPTGQSSLMQMQKQIQGALSQVAVSVE